MQLLSTLATIGFVLPVFAALMGMLLARRDYSVAAAWGGGVVLSLLIALAIRGMLRADPDLPHFPSGHVTLAVAFYGGLLVIYLRGGHSHGRMALPLIITALASIALVEGWSRVLLTEHTWVDVIGGFVVGSLGLLATGCPWAVRRIQRGSRLYLAATLAVAIPLAFLNVRWLDSLIRTFVVL
ncbi:phosphatase PAP2 family protein [Nitrospirillum amazonense]|uniref:PAP2 superfamily protein n=1 Tax=Nitrospirillum amazonense TaxID=28077 RepID=A0A560JN60_9PROT|nr:phosphatase PAP2 family protein [Nitrospirillum amazonense]MDG3442930.1 phosphatase PAP2 family protein [Nitrospirillum amazonense]TWB71999.1 PAP2 superfamily protein [Nitrospirillum amazonense]